MEWAEETIVRLRALWDEGHSSAEIGRRLGVSKNAVVGKAHRLDLPARPSPIKRDGGPTPPSQSRPGRPRRVSPSANTLPPLSSAVPTLMIPTAQAVHLAAPVLVARQEQPVIARIQRRHDGTGCCFPIGEPGTKTFRYCDADLDITGEYCPEHHKLTVQKVRRPSRALDEAA